MPYIMETCVAGRTKEVCKRYSTRYGRKNINRGPNVNPTPEAVKKVNERNAITNLRRLIHENFGYQDIHLVLTYRRNCRPKDPAAAKKDLEKVLRDLRTYHKKRGSEFKYIAVTEYKNTAIHHHLIINSMDTRDLTDIWKQGQPRPTYLDNSGNYSKLAEYLVKETRKTYREKDGPCRKRWSSSTNLRRPSVKKAIVKANSWRQEPAAPTGYYLDKDSVITGFHELTGHGYQFYMLLRLPGEAEQEGGMRFGHQYQRSSTKGKGAGACEVSQPAGP